MIQIIGIVAAIAGLAYTVYSLVKTSKVADEISTQLHESADSIKQTLFDDVTRAIFDNLKANQSLTFRLTDVDVDDKKFLGDKLCDQESGLLSTLVHLIDDQPRSLFIESGSTLSYLCYQLCEAHFFLHGQDRITVLTNNVLVDHLCVYEEGVAPQLLSGTPSGQYGATFGNVPPIEPEDLVRIWRDKTKNNSKTRPIDSIASFDATDFYIGTKSQYAAMESDTREFFSTHGFPGTILMTSSKLSLHDGPHVGSFQNRDFKEILFHIADDHNRPVFLIIYDAKIHKEPIEEDRCLSVFGDDAMNMDDDGKYAASKLGLGMCRFLQAIADGKLVLVVTSIKQPAGNFYDDNQSPSGKLFHVIEQHQESLFGEKEIIEGLESPDRHVRIFKGVCPRLERRDEPNVNERIQYLNILKARLSTKGYVTTKVRHISKTT